MSLRNCEHRAFEINKHTATWDCKNCGLKVYVNFTIQGRSVTDLLDESVLLEIDNKMLRDRIQDLEDELKELGITSRKVN